MKRALATLMCVIIMLSMTLISINALEIKDGNGNVVGTSVLTSSSGGRVYTLVVTDTTGGSTAYGAIYLYDANGNMIDGGWDGYYRTLTLTKGNSERAVTYRNIRSSIQGIPYTYYQEY